MKIVPLLLAPCLTLGGCVSVISHLSAGDADDGGSGANGTGAAIDQARKAETATAAEFSGPFLVEIRRGAPALTVRAQKEALPHLKTEFKGSRLRVWMEGSTNTSKDLRVVLTMPGLTSVEADGSATVDAGAFSGGAITISLDGASSLRATGSAEALKLTLSGASTADLPALAAKRAEVRLNGASTANLRVTDALTGTADGASTVNYAGGAKASVEANGASSVNAK